MNVEATDLAMKISFLKDEILEKTNLVYDYKKELQLICNHEEIAGKVSDRAYCPLCDKLLIIPF